MGSIAAHNPTQPPLPLPRFPFPSPPFTSPPTRRPRHFICSCPPRSSQCAFSVTALQSRSGLFPCQGAPPPPRIQVGTALAAAFKYLQVAALKHNTLAPFLIRSGPSAPALAMALSTWRWSRSCNSTFTFAASLSRGCGQTPREARRARPICSRSLSCRNRPGRCVGVGELVNLLCIILDRTQARLEYGGEGSLFWSYPVGRSLLSYVGMKRVPVWPNFPTVSARAAHSTALHPLERRFGSPSSPPRVLEVQFSFDHSAAPPPRRRAPPRTPLPLSPPTLRSCALFPVKTTSSSPNPSPSPASSTCAPQTTPSQPRQEA